MKNIQVFSDFDGTITKEDTLNKFLRIYADKKWLEVEDRWIQGDIGSKECIEEQMKLFPAMTQKIMDDFVDSIEIDETFVHFYDYLKSENIDFYIVSDGFDLFIERILGRYGIKDVKIFSNKLNFNNKKSAFETAFPYCNHDCERQSGVCKCNVIKNNRIVTKRLIYAGDGMSDFCVSDKADVLFAKGSLLEYCKNTKNDNCIGFDPIAFKSFDEIEEYIKRL